MYSLFLLFLLMQKLIHKISYKILRRRIIKGKGKITLITHLIQDHLEIKTKIKQQKVILIKNHN